jgi:hypothetical protein
MAPHRLFGSSQNDFGEPQGIRRLGEHGLGRRNGQGISVVADSMNSQQENQPIAGLDLDTAIRLRWALRDIKANRTKLSPLRASDLQTLIAMELVEMHDDVPALTTAGFAAIDK